MMVWPGKKSASLLHSILSVFLIAIGGAVALGFPN